MKLCECGCGQPAPTASMTNKARGYVKGEPRRFIVGHNNRRSLDEHRVDAETGCWVWLRATNGNGYGQRTLPGRVRVLAHRYAYEQAHGAIPPNCDVHHVCGTRLCVNPEHLVAMPRREHMQEHRPTHCHKGHEFTPENTYVTPAGLRQCRICKRERERLGRARRKAAA